MTPFCKGWDEETAELDSWFLSPAGVRAELDATPKWRFIRRHVLKMDLLESEIDHDGIAMSIPDLSFHGGIPGKPGMLPWNRK